MEVHIELSFLLGYWEHISVAFGFKFLCSSYCDSSFDILRQEIKGIPLYDTIKYKLVEKN